MASIMDQVRGAGIDVRPLTVTQVYVMWRLTQGARIVQRGGQYTLQGDARSARRVDTRTIASLEGKGLIVRAGDAYTCVQEA